MLILLRFDLFLSQFEVETIALAHRNFNVPCESGIRYPTLTAMLNPQEMLWRPSVRT